MGKQPDCSEPPCLLPPTLTAPSQDRGLRAGAGRRGEGHLQGHNRVTNGEECSHQSPSLRAHQIFMAIKRPNFLPMAEPTAQSTAGQTRRGSLGTAPAGSAMSLSWSMPQAGGSLRGAGSGSDHLAASPRGHARRQSPQPAGRCVHPLNNLHPPRNGPRRCQSH